MIHRTPNLIKLKNGIRLLSFPLSGTQTITALVLVKVGSRHEKSEICGISHFLEHLFFKGTKKRPTPLVIAEEIEQIGAYSNAFTSKEYTGFFITAAAEHLTRALDILSDILKNSIFDSQEIERERDVIVEEMRLYFDTPMERVGEIFETLLYGNHPLGKDIIGTMDTVKNISRGDIINHMKKYYHGDNVVVALSGKLTNKDVKSAVSFFETFENGVPYKIRPIQENQSSPQLLIEKKATDQAHIAVGVRTFALNDPRKEALDLLAVILGSGKSSRMFQRVREKLGLAYYIDTEPAYYTDTGYLVTYAGVNREKINLAIKTILREYQKITQELITEEELNKIKEYVKGRLLIELESSFRMARLVGTEELLLERRESLQDYFARLFAITRKDIQNISQTIFQSKNLNLAIIGPFDSQEQFMPILNDFSAL